MLLNQTDFILSQLLFNFKTANNKKDAIFIQIYFSLLYNPFPQIFIEMINFVNINNITPAFIDKDLFVKKHNIIIKRLLVLKPLHFVNKLPSGYINNNKFNLPPVPAPLM